MESSPKTQERESLKTLPSNTYSSIQCQFILAYVLIVLIAIIHSQTESPRGLALTSVDVILGFMALTYINGKWVPVKAGDLHVCPRGVAHATRTLPGKELLTFNMFTPPQPKGAHDRVMIDE